MTTEAWRAAVGYEGRYEVSDLGRVRRIAHGHSAKPGQIVGSLTLPYAKVVLSDSDHKRKTWRIHQLVLEAFVGPCPTGLECRHLDGNTHNNNLSNLTWGTRTDNAHDRVVHGTWTHGELHGQARLTDEIVREARRLRSDGQTILSLANQYGVCRQTMSNALRGKTWAHVALSCAELDGYHLQTDREETA